MIGISKFLSGKKILYSAESKYNGKLEVVRDLAWGTYIQAGGITQSGGVVETIWKTLFRKLNVSVPKRILILGLGGGTVSKLARKKWPFAKIVGVEIDETMLQLGTEYLSLGKSRVEIRNQDAYKFALSLHSSRAKYDLLFVDLYCADHYPKKFESEEFLKNVRKILNIGGTAVFNRLYYGNKRGDAMRFLKKLEAVFGEDRVSVIYPEANVMFVCNN